MTPRQIACTEVLVAAGFSVPDQFADTRLSLFWNTKSDIRVSIVFLVQYGEHFQADWDGVGTAFRIELRRPGYPHIGRVLDKNDIPKVLRELVQEAQRDLQEQLDALTSFLPKGT